MGVLGRYNYYNESTQTYDAGQTAKDPYIFEDVLPSDYTDITSIENAHLYSGLAGLDYLGIRSKVKDLFYDAGKLWVNCTNEEKQLVVDYSVYMDQDDANATTEKITFLMTENGLTNPESIQYIQTAYAKDHVLLSTACKCRAGSVSLYEIVAKYLSNDDALDFKNTVRTLLSDYKEDSLIGTQYSTTTTESGIVDYFKSQAGSDYEFTGLASKGYTMQNGDVDETNLINDLSNLFADNYKFSE